MRTLKFLTYDDRKIIEKMYKSGASKQMIADAIDKNYSTTPKKISINKKEITWNTFIKLMEEIIPSYKVALGNPGVRKKMHMENKELKVPHKVYNRLLSGQQKCVLVDTDCYKEAELIKIYATDPLGNDTESIEFAITYVNSQESGIEKGYLLLNLELVPLFG